MLDPHVPPGEIVTCAACTRLGYCRLGVEEEALDDEGVLVLRIRCPVDQEGGRRVAHGGWTAAMLDEMLGHVPIHHGQMTVTGTIEVRFVKPVPLEVELEGRAWVARREPGKWFLAGELRLVSSGALLASGHGVWIERDPSHFDRFDAWFDEQQPGNVTA